MSQLHTPAPSQSAKLAPPILTPSKTPPMSAGPDVVVTTGPGTTGIDGLIPHAGPSLGARPAKFGGLLADQDFVGGRRTIVEMVGTIVNEAPKTGSGADAKKFNLRDGPEFKAQRKAFASATLVSDITVELCPQGHNTSNYQFVMCAVPSLGTAPADFNKARVRAGATHMMGGSGMGRDAAIGPFPGSISTNVVRLPNGCSPILAPLIVSDLAFELYYDWKAKISTGGAVSVDIFISYEVEFAGMGYGNYA